MIREEIPREPWPATPVERQPPASSTAAEGGGNGRLRRTLRLGRLTVLVALLLATAVLATNNLLQWLHYGMTSLSHTDFTLYYIFARMGLEHGWNRLYDLGAQRQVYSTMPGVWWFPMVYTPPMAWLTAPFTLLPLAQAYWIWSGLVAASFLGAWWLASPRELLLKAVCLTAALAPYLTLLGLALGQFIVIQLFAAALGTWLLKKDRQVAAGLAFIAIDLHPQGFFLIPLVLLVFGTRRTFLVWAAGTAILVLAAVATLHRSGVLQYIHQLIAAESSPLQFYVAYYIDLPTMIGSAPISYAVQGALVFLTGLVAYRQRRGRGQVEVAVAAGLVGSVLVTSFIHLDDLMVLLLAGWLTLSASLPGVYRWLPALGLLIALPMDNDNAARYGLLMVGFEIAWLVALALAPAVNRTAAARGEEDGAAAPVPSDPLAAVPSLR